MRVAISCIIKDENQYLEEWILYHKSIGIDKFYLGDNCSKIPIQDTITELNIPDIEVIYWPNQEISGQTHFYKFVADRCSEDFLAAIDTDEFIRLKDYTTIQEFLKAKTDEFGYFSGLGMYWRFYGSNPPFETRKRREEYTQYHENEHIKSIFRPHDLQLFLNPHFPKLNKKIIDELGNPLTAAQGMHISKNIWIQHNWTRSRQEFKEKLVRGSGDKINRNFTMTHFYDYNNQCTLKE